MVRLPLNSISWQEVPLTRGKKAGKNKRNSPPHHKGEFRSTILSYKKLRKAPKRSEELALQRVLHMLEGGQMQNNSSHPPCVGTYALTKIEKK